LSGQHTVWQFLGPGSGYAFAESQRGLSEDQENAIYFGQPLPEPRPDVEIAYLSEGRLGGVIGSSFSALIVSATVRTLLGQRASAQFIPVRLPRHSGRDYAVLNVLAHVACFDARRSDYDRIPGHPERLMAVRRLVLHAIPATAPPLFHVAELPGAILVRADLRAELEELDGVGEFVDVADFTWGLT
jgi:hypothetical protein